VVEGGGLEGKALETAELVRRAKRGESHAFSLLIARMERTALAIAFSVCGGDAALAGDITQEAFLRAWRRLAELHDNARFAAWLCGIVRNLAIDARRSNAGRKRRTRGEEHLEKTLAADADEPLAGLARAEQSQAIARAIEQLDEISRTVIVLRYYENVGSAEIAELIDSTPTAVNMRLSRARRALKDLLAGEADETPCTAGNKSRTDP
jgi:RNA polymerase sigma factor (sigma-70 family)